MLDQDYEIVWGFGIIQAQLQTERTMHEQNTRDRSKLEDLRQQLMLKKATP